MGASILLICVCVCNYLYVLHSWATGRWRVDDLGRPPFQSKVTSSRSNSAQSFDEALKEAEAAKKQAESATPATVVEEKAPQ